MKLLKITGLRQGFTLVELLVVVAIVFILAAVVFLILDPTELQRQARDSARLADLANLNNAISTAASEATPSAEAILCHGGKYPCSGASYPLGTDTRKNDGIGWIKVDLTSGPLKDSMLFIDPTNDSAFHYTYCADNDAWELNTTLESKKQKEAMSKDTGDQNATDPSGKYEVGTNLTLINSSGSPCAY
jgi:prepilin-type N-terminal cleavage/methylation domain-containing protein